MRGDAVFSMVKLVFFVQYTYVNLVSGTFAAILQDGNTVRQGRKFQIFDRPLLLCFDFYAMSPAK